MGPRGARRPTLDWPAAHGQVGDGPFIAPSLDVSASFHRPASHAERLLIDATFALGDGGLLAAQGQVWEEAGQLIASGGAQLCCVPRR